MQRTFTSFSSLRVSVLTLAIAFLIAKQLHAQYAITFESNVAVRMRDGAILRADIYRPNVKGRFPVLLQRTPYNKDGGVAFGIKAAEKGYVVIFQDVRGRFASEGQWYPLRNEMNDGYDTVEWAAALPYSDGRVGMFGASYVGGTQLFAAMAHPPHLAGICPIVADGNFYNLFYTGGAFAEWFTETWSSKLAQDTYGRLVNQRYDPVSEIWRTPLDEDSVLNIEGHPDLASAPTVAPYFLDWLAHPNYDTYWKKTSIEEHYSDITVPALHIAGWYDALLGGSIRDFQGIRDHGGSEAARKGQRLIVMVGGHAGAARKVGDIDFGPNAKDTVDDWNDWTLQWYDHLFKGAKDQFAAGKPVKIFVMGADEWRDEDNWPILQAKLTKYFLHSDGKANSIRGDGSLSTAAPGNESVDLFVYNPAKPVPTVGGPLCCDPQNWPAGPRDQRAVESRHDVLVYSTAPMGEDMEVTGPVTLELYARSSAVDTDFTAKLVDVWPNGYAQNLTEGILRTRYRESREKLQLMNPGQVYKLSIDLWATSDVFKKGHVLRLEVSSSNFPRFERNPNAGESVSVKSRYSGENFVIATNTVLHDVEHPSALILPVVPPKLECPA
jgi:hypothetical protein